MPIILNKWDTMIIGDLSPGNAALSLLTEASIQSVIKESEEEQSKIRILLIERLVDSPKTTDKQTYVHLNQTMLIRLLDKLYSYKQIPGVCDKILFLYDTIGQHLQNILDFIEDFFSNYFNRNEKLPASYRMVSTLELKKQLRRLVQILTKDESVDKCLITDVMAVFQNFTDDESSNISYLQLSYQKELMKELLLEKALASTQSFRETLYYFNFNEDNFIAYEYERLQQLTNNLPAKKEKITLLRFEQKNINQVSTKLNCSFTINMPSLKEQVNGWIDEEVKFLENGNLIAKTENGVAENEHKIHTSLSVAKLALLIKLLVIDKIIINRTVAPMLRIIAKLFTTLQREDISFGSMETKYHAPDKATISAVRDMLFKWINILNKL
jgi:hypothetical protein